MPLTRKGFEGDVMLEGVPTGRNASLLGPLVWHAVADGWALSQAIIHLRITVDEGQATMSGLDITASGKVQMGLMAGALANPGQATCSRTSERDCDGYC